MANSLKGKTVYVFHDNTGSQGQLVFSDNVSATYNVGGQSTSAKWGEKWMGNLCYLWVVFDNQTGIRIWGIQLTLDGEVIKGQGVSAMGNADPNDPGDSSFINDDLEINSSPRT
ncbi:hypothetical protein P4S60_06710 [Pseudoalteromonas sp. Hal040]|uniref:hypothetical protein n=1 Tax=Pseudoalteromonas TaxID=53246 RepID=UPI000CF5E8A4|nr:MULTISPECIES: hypothetical protein [Pseudoalteromonas]MCZ4251895.1 hypothetical protein [Pseudoalteromonas shioyasakiensis]